VEGFCEHGNDPSGAVKCWDFLSNCIIGFFIRKGSAP
jgi:hypothetical protein